MMASALAAVAGILALGLLLKVFRLRKALRREQEESCRLRKLLQIGTQAASNDLAQARKLRHDLRQYLILAESAAVLNAPADLRGALGADPSAEVRDSWVVSALEQHYLAQAKALGFQADLRITLPQAWEEAIPDVCLVLRNLLENAIEALQREGGGWLRARSVATTGYFSLVVGNACTRPLRTLGGRYLSSKAPGRFGIGLETVREVAQRCGGQAEFTTENGEFRASVFLTRPEPAPQGTDAPRPSGHENRRSACP